MKFWEIWFVSGIGILLIICSVVSYQFSSESHFTASLDTSKLEKFLDSGKELHLSKKQTKQLIQAELEAATHQSRGMKYVGESIKEFSELLLIAGVFQMVLCFLIFKKFKKLRHNNANGADGV